MFQRADQQSGASRYRRASAIADRYIGNIQGTRSYQSATSTSRSAVSASPEMRGYSRSTYMGIRSALGGQMTTSQIGYAC